MPRGQMTLQRLDDEDVNVQNSAVNALAAVVSSDPDVRQAILQRFDDQNANVRGFVVSALAGLVPSNPEVRQAILQRLDDQNANVRSSAVNALAALVSSDPDVRQAILQRLDDQNANVRSSAVNALAALVSSDPDVRQAVLQRLDDPDWKVRMCTVSALSKLEEVGILEKAHRQKLAQWLTSKMDEYDILDDDKLSLEKLFRLFGSRLANDSSLRDTVLDWLKSPRWPTRLGAVRTLLNWSGGTPKEILQRILESLNDNRGLESYSARLTAASYLINRDPYSQEAIQLGLEALDYGTLPWEYFPRESGEVRKQAALLLGTLEPVRYDQVVYDKLLHAMKTDQDSSVRDTLYTVLVKLAGMRPSPC